MKWSRAFGALAALVLLAALGVASAESTCNLRSFPASVPCNASALAGAYSHVDSVASFGCVGSWAYLWATVGKGPSEVGVTEVLHYDVTTTEWKNASRLRYCEDDVGVLPAYVKYWGCNSN
jgi:hypothetical protein